MEKTSKIKNWFKKVKEEALKKSDSFQYLIDRLYYAEKENLHLQYLVTSLKKNNKSLPIIIKQDEAEKFVDLLRFLILETDRTTLFESIVKGLHKNMDYHRVGIMLYDKKENQLISKSSVGLPKKYINNLKISPENTKGEHMWNYLAKSFSESKPLLISKRYNEDKFNQRMGQDKKTYSVQYAIIPIIGKKITLGILTVGISSDNKKFLTENEITLLSFFSNQIAIAIENNQLINEIEDFYRNLIITFGNVIELRDKNTAGHCFRLMVYASEIGKKLNFNKQQLFEIELAAALHDIGKISISDKILNKNGQLNNKEFNKIKEHTGKGYDILKTLKRYPKIADAVLYHHERWDGKGYAGLKGKKIPLYARILTLIDAFDVIHNKRPYKDASTIKETRKEIKKCSGKHFDPELVKILLNLSDDKINNIQKKTSISKHIFKYFPEI